MSTVQQIIFAASAFTLTAVAWLLYSVWPLYRAATGRTRTLLGSIVALTVALGANGLFWPILLLIPPATRAVGGPLRPRRLHCPVGGSAGTGGLGLEGSARVNDVPWQRGGWLLDCLVLRTLSCILLIRPEARTSENVAACGGLPR